MHSLLSEPEPTRDQLLVVLRRARARIAPIERWTVGAVARIGLIPLYNPCSPFARQWSADGAIEAEAGGQNRVWREAYRTLAGAVGVDVTKFYVWQDEQGHGAVLRAFDKALDSLSGAA